MNNKLKYSNFFSDPGIFKDFFDRFENAWEAIQHIEEFIDAFDSKYQELSYTKIREGLYVGQDVKIDESAKIDGKAIVGHKSTVGHAAYLRGGILFSDSVHIGHATEIKHSIVLSNTALAHLNYVGDSILGSGVNLSGGATLANWRFDKKDITVRGEGFEIPTGMEKLGSIIGDESFIGVNAVINPGTILSKKTLVFPLVSVKGVHLDRETIK